MNVLFRILLANIRIKPARTALTALAVIASSCIVVWVVSGYDALVSQSIDDNAARALGRFDLIISNDGPRPGAGLGWGASRERRANGQGANAPGKRKTMGSSPAKGGPGTVVSGLPPELIASVKQDSRVAEATSTSQSRVTVSRVIPVDRVTPMGNLLRGDRPPVIGMPPLDPPLIGTDAIESPYELRFGRWIDPAAGDRGEGVLSESYAEDLHVGVGDEVKVISEIGERVLKVIGIMEQPRSTGGAGRGSGTPAGLFVTLPFFERVNGYPARIEQVQMVLGEGVDLEAYRRSLSEKLGAMNAKASIVDVQAMRESMNQGLSQVGARTLAYTATGIALVAALFIIFTTLTMGVNERARELAVLRAVGMTRTQVAGLVFLEGLALAILGWVGGLAAGWGLLTLVSGTRPSLFPNGATLGPWCVLLTGISAFGGALAASILPAWGATRIAPLEAMSAPRVPSPSRWILPSAVAGLVLLTINPLLTYVLPMADSTRSWAYALAGYPGMTLGFVLLAPWVILVIETWAGPTVARFLGLPPQLLASTLSTNLWRTFGTTVALTVGLGLYVATQTWGYSMLGPFMPGDWAPQVLVGFEPSGLPLDQFDAVRRIKGVNADRCLPLAVEQPRLVKDLSTVGGNSLSRQNNVVLIGLDPQLAFGGDDPILNAKFVAGDRKTALEKLKSGGACIVPDAFLTTAGLKLGDPLELIPPDGPAGRVVSYEVVGTVSLPGWHWMTKATGLRRRIVRTAAMVFAPIADVQRDFTLDRINFVWLDTDGTVNDQELEAAMQKSAEAHGEPTYRLPGVGEVAASHPYARLTSADALRAGVRARADELIWGMSYLPLVTLLITTLAVANTIIASVRARRWELGILRAIGTTRGGILRLVLAESILIGIAVCALGVSFGVMAGWCGIGMARYVNPFGGMDTPLVIPWAQLSLGLVLTLVLCLLAALRPAFVASSAEPLSLLRAGRNS